MDEQRMATLVDQDYHNASEHVTQLGAHNGQLLLELQQGRTPLNTTMIEHFKRVAKFIDDATRHQCKQTESTVVLAVIQGMSQLVKDQSSVIKAIKSHTLKQSPGPQPMSYEDALTRPPPAKTKPAPFKANEVIVKINDQGSSDSLRQAKEADLVGLINDTLKKENITNIDLRAVQKLKNGDLAIQTLNQDETQKLKNNNRWTEIFSKQAKTIAKQYQS